MKKILVLLGSVLALSACVSPPQVNFAEIDNACGQQCSANHTACISGFKLFPVANEMACKTAMETCAKTCGSKASNSGTLQKTALERLTALDTALKNGLITQAEYDNKRAEILKTM